MKILYNEVNGNKYTFVCEYWETSRAWGHKVTMFKNLYEWNNHKIRYYNRTWECYPYQSCILGVIRKTIQEEQEKAINNYKYANNVKRLTKEQKEEIYKGVEKIAELEQLYKMRSERA